MALSPVSSPLAAPSRWTDLFLRLFDFDISDRSPDPVEHVQNHLARALLTQTLGEYRSGRLECAEHSAVEAVRRVPSSARCWEILGVISATNKNIVKAEACFRRTILLTPDKGLVWLRLGKILIDRGSPRSALSCVRRAAELVPDDIDVLAELARTLLECGEPEAAARQYEEIGRLAPDDANARFALAVLRLRLGDFARGWPDYELRFDFIGDAKPYIRGPVPLPPRWTGQDLGGKTLLVLSEQGFGDQIWAARFFAPVKARGGHIIVQTRNELAPLFRQALAPDEIVETGETLPRADYHVFISSLPGVLKADFDTAPVPYLRAPAAGDKFDHILSQAGARLKVGIIWSGSPHYAYNKQRSAPLDLFLKYFDFPQVQLYSLQKFPAARALEPHLSLKEGDNRIINAAPLLNDFADTAAFVAKLDLVIMTDTAVAHLTGALGKPIWLLLHFSAGQPWIWGKADCPWYPSMRVFRQPAPNDWANAFDAAAAALIDLTAGRTAPVPGPAT